jgi:hypothetical protein
MAAARSGAVAGRLPGGQIIVAGGTDGDDISVAALWDPAADGQGPACGRGVRAAERVVRGARRRWRQLAAPQSPTRCTTATSPPAASRDARFWRRWCRSSDAKLLTIEIREQVVHPSPYPPPALHVPLTL